MWAVVAATAIPADRSICAVPYLAALAARRAQQALHHALSLLSFVLPMPVAPWVRPDDQARCAALLAFFQVAFGALLPLLYTAFGEARLFLLHQQDRRAAGLPPERGLHASAYAWLWCVTLGGSSAFTAALVCVLLGVAWDYTAFFSVPVHQRSFG